MKAAVVFTEWQGSSKEAITVRHILNHTSGIEITRTCFVGGSNWPGAIADGLAGPREDMPGQVHRYNNRGVDLLSLFVGYAVSVSPTCTLVATQAVMALISVCGICLPSPVEEI